MANKYLDDNGLLYLWQKIVNNFVKKDGNKVLSTNDYTTEEKTKLAGIATGATKTTVDENLSSTSTNPVQNKTVNAKFETKVDKENGKGLSTNDYTTNEKAKVGKIITNGAGTSFLANDGTYKTITTPDVPVKDVQVNKESVVNVDGVAELHKIASSGSYADLTNVPTNLVKDSSYTHTDNNYTTEEKTKLTGIATGAQVNVIESIKVNGTAVTPVSKAVDITVPTNNNQLTNGAGYQTANQVTTAINNAIKDITGISFSIVESLPTTGVNGVIYLISHTPASTQNIYDEYIWIASSKSFEKIGSTDVDLSGYLKTTDIIAITNDEIDTIIAS